MSALKMFNTKFHSAIGDGTENIQIYGEYIPPKPKEKTALVKAAEFVDKYHIDKLIIIVGIAAIVAQLGYFEWLRRKLK